MIKHMTNRKKPFPWQNKQAAVEPETAEQGSERKPEAEKKPQPSKKPKKS